MPDSGAEVIYGFRPYPLRGQVPAVGLCLFGCTVTNINLDLIMSGVDNAAGEDLPADFFMQLGIETLMIEEAFNRDAGFDEGDDKLPGFYYEEALAPTWRRAPHLAVGMRAGIK